MSDKSTIVLVHGFWGGTAHWGEVIVELSRLGDTRLRAVELPLTSLAVRRSPVLAPCPTSKRM